LQELLADLISILESQREAQAALAGLSERKTQAITAGDAGALQAVVEEERAVLARIKAIERKQGQCTASLAAQFGVAAAEVRMSLVIEKAGGEQRQALIRLRDELSDLVDRQIRHNDINMKLLQMNMDYVQFLINASSNQQAGATYGNAGSIQKAVGSVKRLLDRKV
jgi:flagellar biosynthesis/type III secretory pathway chaperone